MPTAIGIAKGLDVEPLFLHISQCYGSLVHVILATLAPFSVSIIVVIGKTNVQLVMSGKWGFQIMASEAYEDNKGTSLFKPVVFWASLFTLVASMGENLLRGWTVIDKVIDAWHAVTVPLAAWLSEYVFAWWEIEVSQHDIDLIVVFGFLMRMFFRSFTQLSPPPNRLLTGIVFLLAWVIVSTSIILQPETQFSALASIKAGDKLALWTLGGSGVASLVLRLFRNPHVRGYSMASGGLAIFVFLVMLLELNAHADEHLPYIERWLTAWDEIFVGE